jgi:C_GCAxxG_C_C family probable redox protein
MSEPVKKEKSQATEKRVHALMETYHNCAQCTLVAIMEASGFNNDELAKASSGFAGGIGGMQSVCGALTGGALALGLKYGRDVSYLDGPAEAALKKQEESIEQVARLVKWFEREFGSIICLELRKLHMGTELSLGVPWQNEWADQLGMKTRCADIAARTALRTLRMLENPKLGILD